MVDKYRQYAACEKKEAVQADANAEKQDVARAGANAEEK